jgi:hypothetical protein
MPKNSLIEMLKYKRPSNSWSEEAFCRKYLEPVFGDPDEHGNYIKIIYEPVARGFVQPNVCFTAHYDTVHTLAGMQQVLVTGDIVTALQSNCLGADCTTGVWLILGMMEKKIPGVYVVHSGEESGCIGSSALVKDNPDWLQYVKAVISFDRKGEESIITHQMGARTASDAFAISLSDALDMPSLRPDNTGSYTDSNEYAGVVSECTNLSVGYLYQHTAKESQNIFFAYLLLDKLISADWSKLVFERDASTHKTYEDYGYYRNWGTVKRTTPKTNEEQLLDLIYDYPEAIAGILDGWDCDAEYLYDQIRQSEEDDFYRRVG